MSRKKNNRSRSNIQSLHSKCRSAAGKRKSAGVDEALTAAFEHHQKGDFESAEQGYTKILEIDPANANAMHLLGVVAMARGKNSVAEQHIRKAIQIINREPIFYNNLGTTLFRQGRLDEAVIYFEKSLKLNPNYANAHINYGTALKAQGSLEKAKEHFKKAVELLPHSAEAYYNLGTVYQDQANLGKTIAAYDHALKLKPDFVEAQSNLLFNLNYSTEIEPAHLSDIHRLWAKNLHIPGGQASREFANVRSGNRPLRIGYVSPDFRQHSVAFFALPIFKHHDRSHFEIFAYADVEKPDEITGKFESLADRWLITEGMSDQQLFEQIQKDKIDILVDLAGHSGKNRLILFARRPAPLQVSYLGYPNTTGLETIDYRITDNQADPEGVTDHLYTEKLVRLPGCFLCYRNLINIPIAGDLQEREGVTFGSFNTGMKINAEVIGLWSQILLSVPGSKFILKAKHFQDERIVEEWQAFFMAKGVDPARIDFHAYLSSAPEHMALYNSIDIALDTFPYNGTTTTCEALWMGVPVITLAGKHHASRVGASLLETVGLSEYIAETQADYLDIAVNKAADVRKNRNNRQLLRDKMSASALMDEAGFALKLENAFRYIWLTWCDILP
jgi:predicted O-linked N-acetylglucosamine transferase (SPINDLY family)